VGGRRADGTSSRREELRRIDRDWIIHPEHRSGSTSRLALVSPGARVWLTADGGTTSMGCRASGMPTLGTADRGCGAVCPDASWIRPSLLRDVARRSSSSQRPWLLGAGGPASTSPPPGRGGGDRHRSPGIIGVSGDVKYKVLPTHTYHGDPGSLERQHSGLPRPVRPAAWIRADPAPLLPVRAGAAYPSCGIACATALRRRSGGRDPRRSRHSSPSRCRGPGVIVPPPVLMVQRICREHECCSSPTRSLRGCRTGRMFAVDHWGWSRHYDHREGSPAYPPGQRTGVYAPSRGADVTCPLLPYIGQRLHGT
jgi:hypothetical protein